MKSKHIKSVFLAAVIMCSISSFVYLNYSGDRLASTANDAVKVEKIDEDDDKVMTELTVMKQIGRKLFEVLTFSIS